MKEIDKRGETKTENERYGKIEMWIATELEREREEEKSSCLHLNKIVPIENTHCKIIRKNYSHE